MNFNQYVLFCIAIAVGLMSAGLYWLGAIILVVVILVYAFGFYLAWNMLEFWSKLSTVFQDVSEIIAAGEATWFSKHGVNAKSVNAFYRKLSIYKGLFDVRVDEAVIDAYERLHPDFRFYSSPEIQPLTRAMIYVGFVLEHKPEYLPDIQRAVMVRKKVGGKKKPAKEKPLQVLSPVFN